MGRGAGFSGDQSMNLFSYSVVMNFGAQGMSYQVVNHHNADRSKLEVAQDLALVIEDLEKKARPKKYP
jgi:hypothetical protein